LNSRLYKGTVWHARREPGYTFRYSVWYLCLDLAERAQVAKKLWLFSHNRHNVTSLWDKDYAVLDDESCTAVIGERVELLTMPRFLNYVFNPVSFVLRRGVNRKSEISGVTAEVHNTWGERHLYVLDREDGGDVYRSSIDKAFYVSPFLSPEARYEFSLTEGEAGRLRVDINQRNREDEWVFGAGIDVTPLQLTNANLLRLLVSMPLLNVRTIAAIHWQGLKIWLRGAKFRQNPSRIRTKERV
jgi:uncharacterized protein